MYAGVYVRLEQAFSGFFQVSPGHLVFFCPWAVLWISGVRWMSANSPTSFPSCAAVSHICHGEVVFRMVFCFLCLISQYTMTGNMQRQEEQSGQVQWESGGDSDAGLRMLKFMRLST